MAAATDSPRTRRIAVAEYYRMAEAGILAPNERIELLNGRIVEMPPIGPRHGYSVVALDKILQRTLNDRAIISVQGPFTSTGTPNRSPTSLSRAVRSRGTPRPIRRPPTPIS